MLRSVCGLECPHDDHDPSDEWFCALPLNHAPHAHAGLVVGGWHQWTDDDHEHEKIAHAVEKPFRARRISELLWPQMLRKRATWLRSQADPRIRVVREILWEGDLAGFTAATTDAIAAFVVAAWDERASDVSNDDRT
jgi:hypothetical protein